MNRRPNGTDQCAMSEACEGKPADHGLMCEEHRAEDAVIANAPAPVRVQLRRTKGWRMPANTMSVARPGKFGNPFTARDCREAGYIGTDSQIAARCVEAFRVWLGPMWRNNWDGSESESRRSLILFSLPSLRGKNLACWCPLDAPCHADVLLHIANAIAPPAQANEERRDG